MRRILVVLTGLTMASMAVAVSPASGADVEAATSPVADQGAVQAFGEVDRFPVPTFEQVLEPVDITADPSSDGYWRTDAVGRVEASGGAMHAGSAFGLPLTEPVVAMAATPTGQGYWLAAADGGVFSFGDAGFFGSMGGIALVAPIVEVVGTPTGLGYWLIAADGGVFAFGDAGFFGSMGGIALVAPIVAGAPTPTGDGYWMAAADGGVFAFGDAEFFGSMGGIALVSAVMGFAPTTDGGGYWMAARDGGVFAFGTAPFLGSDAGRPASPRTAFAADDTESGYWLSTDSIFGPVGLYDTARPVIVIDPDPTQPAVALEAGTTVQTTGELVDLGGSRWVQVEAADASMQLVRYDDLVPTPDIAPDPVAVPCDGGDEPASFPTPSIAAPPSTGGPSVALVYGVDHQVLADGCERVTVVFGVDGADGRETIDDVPNGVSFTSQGTSAALYFPFIESQRPVITVQTGRAGARARLFTVVRLRNPAGSLEQSLVVHADTSRRMEATFLTDPARVVIDLGPEPAATGAAATPRFGPDGSIESNGSPVVVVTKLLGPGGELTIEGLARAFEATVDVRLRTAVEVPGGGSPVTATFTGGINGTQTTVDGYGVMATDWIDAWGEFAFGIEPLPVGDYELFVGELSPEDGSEQGAYVRFSID